MCLPQLPTPTSAIEVFTRRSLGNPIPRIPRMPTVLPETAEGDPVDLSIVVMFTHDAELARNCLTAIETVSDELPAAETIVIVNASPDPVREVVKASTGARVIESPVNTGTAVAWQLGFSAARGKFVLLMHEDAQPLAGMVPRLLETLREEPAAGAAGPWLDESGPNRKSWNAGWVRFGGQGVRLTPGDLPDSIDQDAAYAIEEISSAVSLWRREAWQEIGGFEERTYPAISVEADSFAGLWARGWSVLVDPRARGLHRTGTMDNAPGLLAGPHLGDYLGERFAKLWAEKWEDRADWFVDLEAEGFTGDPIPSEAIHLAVERAQERRRALPTIPDPPRSEQPISNPESSPSPPTRVTPEIEQRLRAKEREVIDGYTRWLIDREADLDRRYNEVYAAYNQLSADAEQYRRDFDLVVESRWWKLGAKLRRLRPTRRS